MTGLVEFAHQAGILQPVHLADDARRPSGQGVGDLHVDQIQETLAHVHRRHQQFLIFDLPAVAGQIVEEIHEVRAHVAAAAEDAQIGVERGGLGVVVAGADVIVRHQSLFFLANHQRRLGVGLEADQAVGHVTARVLQLARPFDVLRLVKARLDLDEHRHLFAPLGRVDQRLHHG